METFCPTDEQEQILKSFKRGKNIKIHAFAGTGKTRTLTYLAENTKKRGLYIAFNKRVANEAKRKMPNNVTASTIHSVAWKWASESFPKEKIVGNPDWKTLGNALEMAPIGGFSEYKKLSTISLILDSFCNSRDEAIGELHLPWEHNSYINDQDVLRRNKDALVLSAQSAWLRMREPDNALPLGHNGYLKVWSMIAPDLDYDFLMVDEAQDLSPVMLEVVDNFKGQIVLVGDSFQQIYSWRGAIDAMHHDIPTDDHFLTQSFRFGKDLCDLSNFVLRSLSSTVEMKSYSRLGTQVTTENSVDANAYIFRTNAVLIEQALHFHLGNTDYFIVDPNRNISQSVDDYFRLQEGLWGKSQAFSGFNSWNKVVEIAQREDSNPFRGFVDLFEKHDPELIRTAIEASKSKESKTYPTLTTGHQSKGLEWDGVRISDDFCFSPDSLSRDQILEELRLLYVSLTRAKKVLSLPAELKSFCENELGNSLESFAVIDLETTGLYPDQGDRITEIGVVIWRDGKIVDRYESLINPGRSIPAFVQDLTGITNAMVKKARPSEVVLSEAFQRIGDIPLIAHNANFEQKFLNNELGEISDGYSVDVLCTLLLSRRIFPNMNGYKLGDLVSSLRLPKGKAHRALSDAEMTAHLLSKICSTLGDETGGTFTPSANAFKKIMKAAPKEFRTQGIEIAFTECQKRHSRTRYKPHEFSKDIGRKVQLLGNISKKSMPTLTYQSAKTDSKKEWTPPPQYPRRPKTSRTKNELKPIPPQREKKSNWSKGLMVTAAIFFLIFYLAGRSSDQTSPPSASTEPQSIPVQLDMGVVIASQLRHRSCPNVDCSVVDGSARGTELYIIDSRNGWYRVSRTYEIDSNTDEWVSSQYVELIEVNSE